MFVKKFYSSRQEEVTKGVCNCAVSTVPATEPIIQHTLPCNVSCDQEGLEKCQQLCIALVNIFLYYFHTIFYTFIFH